MPAGQFVQQLDGEQEQHPTLNVPGEQYPHPEGPEHLPLPQHCASVHVSSEKQVKTNNGRDLIVGMEHLVDAVKEERIAPTSKLVFESSESVVTRDDKRLAQKRISEAFKKTSQLEDIESNPRTCDELRVNFSTHSIESVECRDGNQPPKVKWYHTATQ